MKLTLLLSSSIALVILIISILVNKIIIYTVNSLSKLGIKNAQKSYAKHERLLINIIYEKKRNLGK